MTLKQFNIRNLLKELFKAVEFDYRPFTKGHFDYRWIRKIVKQVKHG